MPLPNYILYGTQARMPQYLAVLSQGPEDSMQLGEAFAQHDKTLDLTPGMLIVLQSRTAPRKSSHFVR